jgi:hypothetical protein
MIPITPFAWRQSARKAPASIACTRQSSSAGKGPSVRPGPALITPITCPGLRRRPRRKRNRSSQRSQKKTWVAMIPTTPFAWRPTEQMVAASNAFSRRWSSASSGPPARPGCASTTPITSRHLRRRLRRRKPNRRRLSNQRSRRNRRSQRSQRNRCNHRRHRNLRNRSSAERAAPIPVQQVISGFFLVLGNAARTSACGTFATCQLHRAMSEFGSKPEDTCSYRVLLSLTLSDIAATQRRLWRAGSG